MKHLNSEANANPPAFNIPAAVLTFLAAFVVIHIVRTYFLSPLEGSQVLLTFAFIPISYHLPVVELYAPLARYWSPATHGLLHGDWTHLIANSVWFIAFGSAVARRFGTMRFTLFMVLSTIAGATFHYLFHPYGAVPVIGASGAVSACMGAAVRFAFSPGGASAIAVHAPALSLMKSLQNKSIMSFVIFWFVLNWLVGSGIIPIVGDAQIAWEAHMGGFLFGWLAFSLFDPREKSNFMVNQ